MKKLVLYSLILFSIMLFSFNFNPKSDCSTAETGSRNFTCGSCHGGSINTDIIITDGLVNDGNEDDLYFNIQIDIPSDIPTAAFQANLYSNGKGKFSSVSNVKPLFEDQYGAQYALMDLQKSKVGKKEVEPFITQWYPPENFSGSQNIIIEGVFSNLDGTAEGDFSFYKEISIDIKTVEEEFKIYPTIVNRDLNIEGIGENEWVQIFDFSGKNVFAERVNNQKIELSHLSSGNYILKAGKKGSKFLKQ